MRCRGVTQGKNMVSLPFSRGVGVDVLLTACGTGYGALLTLGFDIHPAGGLASNRGHWERERRENMQRSRLDRDYHLFHMFDLRGLCYEV